MNGVLELWIWAFIFLLFSIIARKLYPILRGKKGEEKVSKKLMRLKNEYNIIDDVMIKKKDASKDGIRTTQIDHIVVSPYGIFVIETKCYDGTVYGSDKYSQWKFYSRRGREFFVPNPVRQNYGHIKELQYLLNLDEDDFVNIVTYSNNCDLKIDTKGEVCNFRNLVETIEEYDEVIFTKAEVEEITNKILKANIEDKKLRKEHVRKLKEIK